MMLLGLALAAAAAHPRLPPEVAAFKRRRDRCDHFRGEDPYNDARAAELERQVAAACKGTDAALVRLRARYRANRAVTAVLAGYERDIE